MTTGGHHFRGLTVNIAIVVVKRVFVLVFERGGECSMGCLKGAHSIGKLLDSDREQC